ALHYLVLISEVEEVEIFKICLEYWNDLAAELYRESPFSAQHPILLHSKYTATNTTTKTTTRRYFYSHVLPKVRYIMISRMAKPEEVLVVENDNGEV
ncbi:hypothetical protein LSTR_LSTR014487, partial [Laodelphax striatellus]